MPLSKNLFVALFFLLLCSSCKESFKEKGTHSTLISYRNRDTVLIDLVKFENSFFGNYKLSGPGNYSVIGDVEGKINADTLIGTIYYTPYGWKDKKRRAFVLLMKDGKYFQGKGSEMIYMGIPYFVPETVSFDSVVNVFSAVK
ncbi:hypothetical protein J5U18_05325 [Sphingobacteriaceae bacterium WQ 2009]|uniref:Uncharacterized protein n=1 Tax=Rhinopithecimicrobium faecis TaxID=2820698 RepID=A0A8T4HE47_9SPHI|nr:hypothetical protein [Sphingobacteriaceae bacterium WQ 2009]